jgi:Glucose dehydrogenase
MPAASAVAGGLDLLHRSGPRPGSGPAHHRRHDVCGRPFPNRVFALDATNGDLKWSFLPNTDRAAQGVACCDVVNRGLAYDNGKIFLNTLDNVAIALDAKTGQEIWHNKLGDINLGETMTMAPFVVRGKVLVGNSGGEFGVRGWLTALDENSGKIVWRAYSDRVPTPTS